MPKKGANLGESSDSAMMAACVRSLYRQGPDEVLRRCFLTEGRRERFLGAFNEKLVVKVLFT